MTGVVPVLVAEGSALAAAASTVLQHRASRQAPPGGPRRLLTHLATDPVWILGLTAGAVGLLLHVVALAVGPLVVVQPLLVSGILIALPLSVVLDGHRPSATDWWLAVLLVAALALFLITSRPSASTAPAPTACLLGYAAVALAVLGAFTAAGRGCPNRELGPAVRSALLGAAGGIGFGVTAALLKQATALYAASPSELARSWCGWAVIGVGALSIAITQLAYRAGPLASSLPALTVADPLAAMALGVLAFGERLRESPGMLAAGGAALLLMGAASAVLARRQEIRR